MVRTYLLLFITLILLVVAGCNRANREPNRFEADPELAKEKTAECLMRLDHAIQGRHKNIVEELSNDPNCMMASAAHAEHVNSGQIEAFSRDAVDDHHHEHHHH